MKTGKINRIISILLAAIMLISAPAVLVRADDAAPGKYVSDVFIAYGRTQEEANKWLTDNGWEPISGDNDFTAGKASAFDSDIVTAMGIKRTDKADEAVTDMAVMNMKGGYSLAGYEELLNEKKADIDELINKLMAITQEYRDNYNGKGSEDGKKRADLVYEMLNKFYDGEPGGKGAVNDTGLHLGDLFLAPLRNEAGGENGGDPRQILLESSGIATITVETLLALAADSSENTWLERLEELSEDELSKNISKYVPEAEGQDLAPSAVTNLLNAHFADTAKDLSVQWDKVHDALVWYENYNEENGLWQTEGEADDDYAQRVAAYFDELKERDSELFEEVVQKYNYNGILYLNLYEIPYSGSWGDSLADFFNSADGTDYSDNVEAFLPMAAALSKGQAAALEFVSLTNLIMAGLPDGAGIEQALPDIRGIFGEELELSVYTGVNRDIFRNGVALTSQALMEQNMGRGSVFDRIWDNTGIVAITSYCTAAIGVVTLAAGVITYAKARSTAAWVESQSGYLQSLKGDIYQAQGLLDVGLYGNDEYVINSKKADLALKEHERDQILGAQNKAAQMGTKARILMGIGGALLIAAAVLSAVQLYKYYQRDFTPIPRMIVDESDIITYMTDDNGQPLLDESGKQKKNTEFNSYVYYEAVKCNRQQVGKLSGWQSGVAEYAANGCGDVADLNGDFGQEWLALYTVKSENKGKPILADSLKLQYGSSAQPSGTTQALHMFEYTHATDLGDTAFSYNNKKEGVYFFWDMDENAESGTNAAASTFSGGHLAIAGVIGLLIGGAVATLIFLPKLRKKKQEA